MSTSSERALPLIQEIGRAAIDPSRWPVFVELLADELGGAAIGLTLTIPDIGISPLVYRHNLDPAFNEVTARVIAEGKSPWIMDGLTERFVRTLPSDPSCPVAETEYYALCLIPQGVAPELPLGHVFAHQRGSDLAAIIIYRMEDGRPFDDDDLAMLDRLVPHLDVAYRTHEQLGRSGQRLDALAALVDRFPKGVLLIDGEGRVVLSNRSGERILAAADGLERIDGRVRATLRECDEALQEQIRLAGEEPTPWLGEEALAIRRPSGNGAFSVTVSRLLPPGARPVAYEAEAVLFISDPDERTIPMQGALRSLYDLTEAESHLVSLLCEGHSLESAAAARGVTIHTARAHLKAVFRKTGTKRQGDLIAMALGGLAAVERPEVA